MLDGACHLSIPPSSAQRQRHFTTNQRSGCPRQYAAVCGCYQYIDKSGFLQAPSFVAVYTKRSRTAKASRVSCHAVKSRCARGWGGWGRLSDDGSRQHNSGQSEDPWGGGLPHLHGGARSSARPDTARDYRCRNEARERRTQTTNQLVYAGSRLKPVDACGKVPPYKPAFQPYRGKPAVRNDREGRGNVGIIRSPIRASTLPDFHETIHLLHPKCATRNLDVRPSQPTGARARWPHQPTVVT